MRHGRRAESKTPMADYDAGCRVIPTSTKCRMTKSRTSSSPLILRNASASRRRSRRSSKNLAKTCKSASHRPLHLAPESTTIMRQLAMRFRGLLMGSSIEKLDVWLQDAQLSGVYAMHRFARAAHQDIDAVRNAVLEPWSNGQTEGQINRLKTIKRAMYGRAGIELLRARMIPLQG